jgi:phosphoserine phosphatase
VGPFERPAAADERYAVLTAEVKLDAGRLAAARSALGGLAAAAALVPAGLREAERKLLIMDVDSTLIQQEVIELLADYAGKRAEVTAVTEAAMRGELDFTQSLYARVATLAGLPEEVIAKVRDAVVLSLGAEELIAAFHAAGHVVCAVSGGFEQILAPLAARLGLDHWRANELEVVDARLTGRVLGEVVDRAVKERMLREWAGAHGIPLEHCIAVGDGANDLDMLGAAGLGVAFNAKPKVRAEADAAVDLPYLDVVRHLAGV